MAATTLNLGAFQFGSLEVPAEIEFGGAQRLAQLGFTHRRVLT